MSVGGIAGVSFLPPGVDGIIETREGVIFIGDQRQFNFFKTQQRLINGASRDTGNTADATTILRVGLAMALDSTTNKWEPWVAGDVGGTNLENIKGFLYASIQTPGWRTVSTSKRYFTYLVNRLVESSCALEKMRALIAIGKLKFP